MTKILSILIISIFIGCKGDEKSINLNSTKYHNLGVNQLLENKKDSAILSFRKALKSDSTNLASYEELIKVYWSKNQPDNALELIDKIPKEISQLPSVLIFKGMALEKLNRHLDAQDFYKKAYKKSTKVNYDGNNLMEGTGYYILQTVIGEKEMAIKNIEKLKQQDLNSSELDYLEDIEEIIREYDGEGYNSIFNN